MGAQGAAYFETLTDREGVLSKEQWDKERFGMVCSQPESFADTKKAVEKLCRITGECIYIEDPRVQNFFNRIADFEKTATP